MKNGSSVEAIKDRMIGAGELLLRLGEKPDALRKLERAIDAEDLDGFRAALETGLGGFDPPPELCDPYVRVVVVTVRPPEFVRRCVWVNKGLDPGQGDQLAKAVAKGVAADHLIEVLEALGLIQCTWERVNQDEVIVADKFVQGMCPPGTY
jgi:hypothetical protein